MPWVLGRAAREHHHPRKFHCTAAALQLRVCAPVDDASWVQIPAARFAGNLGQVISFACPPFSHVYTREFQGPVHSSCKDERRNIYM